MSEWESVRTSSCVVNPEKIYKIYKGDVLLEFSSVKWVLNEDHSFYSNLVGTLLSQNFVLDNSYLIHFFRRTNECGDTSH